jgi:hypothetical protein
MIPSCEYTRLKLLVCTYFPAGHGVQEVDLGMAYVPAGHSSVCMWLFYVIFRSDVSIPCSDGSYATGNATSCTQCLAGKICPNTDGTGIEDCLPGTYSTSGATVCTKLLFYD